MKREFRSLVVSIVIGSFSLAALMGIAALLGAGSFGETEARILATTVVIGIESVAVLCYLAVADQRYAPIGLFGGLISFVPTILALYFIWSESFEDDALMRLFFVSLTVAASLAQACLLLSRRHAQPWLLIGTLAAISVVALMIIGPILDIGGDSDTYWRLFGVVAILDALGSIALIALNVFGSDDGPAATRSELSALATARLTQAAASRGMTPEELLNQLLDDL